MKSLFDRLVGGPPAAREPAADDEGFFATQFMERPESVRAKSAWTARALVVRRGARSLSGRSRLLT